MIHEMPSGIKVEYRRSHRGSIILMIECRVLKMDATPYDEEWYPVSDAELTRLQQTGSDIVALLARD